MNSRKRSFAAGLAIFFSGLLPPGLPVRLAGYERFIFRQFDGKPALSLTGRVTLRGEIFSELQAPSSFPSYNDLSGPTDRWTVGFQEFVLVTPTTTVLAG